MAFGCLLRFWKLSNVGFWYDELWTIVGASRPFGEMYREWMVGDSHPPGFFLLYFVWVRLVPATEFWMRLPNAVAGVLTVLYVLFRTRRILSGDERLVTATLAALSYVYVFYALSVKQYSLMLLLVTALTVEYLEILSVREIDRRRGLTLAGLVVALAYLNYFGLVYAALLYAVLIGTFWQDRVARRRLGCIACACTLACAPIVPFLFFQLKYNIDAWQPYQFDTFLANLEPYLFFDDRAFVARGMALVIVVLVGRALLQPRLAREMWTVRNRHLVLIAALFGSFMLVLGTHRPIFYVRYFLAMVPAVMIVVGIAVATAFPLSGWPAVVVFAFFLHGAVTQARSIDALQREQWDQSVDFVLRARAPQDPVYVIGATADKTEFEYLREGDVDGVFNVRNLPFYQYYFRRRGAPAVASQLNVVVPTVDGVREFAAHFRASRKTVYVLGGHHVRFRDDALTTLRQMTRRLEITAMNSTLVYKIVF